MLPLYYLLPRGSLLSRLQKFIPKVWKQSSEKTDDELMVDCLLTTLKNFVSQGSLLKAVTTFRRIRNRVHLSSSSDILIQSLSSLLLCCINLKTLAEGRIIHAHVIALGLGQNLNLVPKLVTFYAAFDDQLCSAQVITGTSNVFHPLPWNILISAYVKNGCYEKAILAYKHMMNKGIRPDKFTYPSVLKACGELLDLELGLNVHKSIEGSPSSWNLFVQNALIAMYAKCGETNIARQIFEKMPEKDAVSWNSMMSAYANKNIWDEANRVFERMASNEIERNIIVWNTIAGGHLRTGNFKGALELIARMTTSHSRLDPVSVITGLSACSNLVLLKEGKEIHGFAIRHFYDKFDNVKNALINMYARCKDFMHTNILFRFTNAKSIITWNTIISGYTHWNQFEEASSLFREMLFSGVVPNYVTIASILPLCARVINLQHGREFHCYITRHEELKDHLLIWNALVDMYARSGKLPLAEKLFKMITSKDAVTYTSLIAGYGVQGKGKKAIELFEEMIRFQINPDHVTMVAVLSACSHSGLVHQGQSLFEQMQRKYSMTPLLEHYACMVDLYGRAGLLKTAEQTIASMPYKPTAEMWATLLGACRIHRNTEIAERAAEKLLEMKPQNAGHYVLITNMHAAAGNFGEGARVRTLMRDLGVRKDPGCAWVDIGAGFSPFVVEDTSCSQADDIYHLLKGLAKQMKDAGHFTPVYFSLEDEVFME